MIEPWEELTRQLRESLHEDASSAGLVVEAETSLDVGATTFDIVVESTGSSEQAQVTGFASVCDLLLTRRKQGKDQVLGCLLVDGEPLASAFAGGLVGMKTVTEFTPVIPLSRERAKALLDADATLFELVEKSTALIDIASSRDPITEEVAATALMEIDELIERAVQDSASRE